MEIEKEIEDFKTKIRVETVHAMTVRKLKPVLSKEWVEELAKF